MWRSEMENAGVDNALKFGLWENDQPMSFATVIELWKTDANFCTFFSRLLAKAKYDAFFWEVPPMLADRLPTPFEFVLVNARFLASVAPEPQAFAEHFNENDVVDFANLGGDAQLIAPCPQEKEETYTHLANFVRRAPELQQQKFWQRVGEIYEQQLGDAPKWLSTSGLGVYWLHVRIDSRPKYYQYTPYKRLLPF